MKEKKTREAERLQVILSRAGISSRRVAEEMIRAGRVRLNGQVVTEAGTRAIPGKDRITVDGRPVRPAPPPVYLLLNKPVGVVTTLADPAGRRTIEEFLPRLPTRVFPVGRLDYHSAGLLLLTSDGDLALRLTHPRYGIRKTYRVKVRGEAAPRLIERLRRGIHLEEGRTRPAEVRVVSHAGRKTWLEMTIAEGKRRQIRRMCEAVGLSVEKLVRVSIGPLRLGRLPIGQTRPLTERELSKLREEARSPAESEGPSSRGAPRSTGGRDRQGSRRNPAAPRRR